MNIYKKLSDLAIRILRLEKKIKEGGIGGPAPTFSIDENGHLIQTNNN